MHTSSIYITKKQLRYITKQDIVSVAGIKAIKPNHLNVIELLGGVCVARSRLELPTFGL